MDLTEYVNDIGLSGKLLKKLKKRVFLRTQLDVVYTDFTNWERGGLISIGDELEKGKWKHLNYSEYVWIKIVEELRAYGFSYDEILVLKTKLLAYLPAKVVLQATLDNKDDLDKINPDIFIQLDASKNDPDFLKLFENQFTYIEDFIINAITFNQRCSILFYKGSLGEFSFLSKKMLEVSDRKGVFENLISEQSRTHLSVSINKIISKFISIGQDDFPLEKPALLEKDEYDLLKIIRNKPENVKKISIQFNNQEIDLIEIESVKKKVDIESRLMDHIKKGDYTTMIITAQDGHISYVSKNEKIKL